MSSPNYRRVEVSILVDAGSTPESYLRAMVETRHPAFDSMWQQRTVRSVTDEPTEGEAARRRIVASLREAERLLTQDSEERFEHVSEKQALAVADALDRVQTALEEMGEPTGPADSSGAHPPVEDDRACDDENCPGWGLGDEVQRCDQCRKFDSDEAARHHVRVLLRSQNYGGGVLDEDGRPTDPEVAACIRALRSMEMGGRDGAV